MQFTGFDDWIEIFRGGVQRDSTGAEHDGDELIAAAVAGFDPKFHEPPVVVGHPTANGPAYGWVAALKSETAGGVRVLLAKIKDVVPEFADLVKRNVYKKRSAAFYPDGRLRHVGFLGAAPPAVKGLADLNFNDEGGESTTFEYQEVPAMATFTQEDLDARLALQKQELEREAQAREARFAEDAKVAEAKAAEAARAAAAAEFAEKERRMQQEARNKDIRAFCDEMVKEGRVIPAWIKSGLCTFMDALDAEAGIVFSEKGNKETGLDFFKRFLKGLPKQVEFGEIATRDKDVSGGDAGEKLGAIVREIQEQKQISYGAAFSEAQRRHPDLAAEYAAELK